MDLLFAIGLLFLGVYDLIFNWEKGDEVSNLMMIIYYFFFGLLMVFAVLKLKILYHYLGFMKGTFTRGLFYLFLAALVLLESKDNW
mmetsp:Transcript_2810/g.2630  ORF Transcript_2810/g.2630 Transcript_2810/m.2630 type:complete len:86 (-) Transcript_2810:160-417(-)